MILTLTVTILCLIMLMVAYFAIQHQNLLMAIIGAGAVSLIASVVYLTLAAPDVAMTEASIGSGLSTIIFIYVLNKIRRAPKND